MELKKIGSKTVLGTYILEGGLTYIEQKEKGKVTVVAMNGINDTVHIDDLKTFIDTHIMDDDIREELKTLIGIILKK